MSMNVSHHMNYLNRTPLGTTRIPENEVRTSLSHSRLKKSETGSKKWNSPKSPEFNVLSDEIVFALWHWKENTRKISFEVRRHSDLENRLLTSHQGLFWNLMCNSTPSKWSNSLKFMLGGLKYLPFILLSDAWFNGEKWKAAESK